MQDINIVPSRCVWLLNVPAAMNEAEIKWSLETIYEGPVKNVFLINQRSLRQAPRKKPNIKIAVEFSLASTVTAVLSERKKWPINGRRIIATQRYWSFRSTVYSDLSRLWSCLNADCLLTLCQYLSFWDVLHLAESSDLLWDFFVENIVPSYARNCELFTKNNYRVHSIAAPLFKRALRLIGPQLTRLFLNGQLLNGDLSQAYMQAVIAHCPNLVSLCLYGFRMNNRFRMHGIRFDQLKELRFVRCKYVGAGWIDLIGQLYGLESLALNDCLDLDHSDSNVDPIIQLRCSKLKKFAVCCYKDGQHCKFLMDVLQRNRANLRELYMSMLVLKENHYGEIAQHMPLLECLWVESLHYIERSEWATSVAADMANLATMQHLRKIIIDGNGPTNAWMRLLAQNPENSVEHLVLRITSADMWLNACSFGAGIRVLELMAIDVAVNEPNNLTFGQQLTGLHTLIFRKTPHMDDVLVAAIELCPALRNVVVHSHCTSKMNLAKIVEALRKKDATASKETAATLNRSTPLSMVFYDSFDKLHTNEWIQARKWRLMNLPLMAANSDILTVTCKTKECDVCTRPIDEFEEIAWIMT